MKTAVILLLTFALAGCGGMVRAVHSTGQIADKYGCLAKELKGEAPCQPQEVPAPPAAPAQ